jgi:hypothetical protein
MMNKVPMNVSPQMSSKSYEQMYLLVTTEK